MPYPSLAKPVQLGAIRAKHGVLMASLTRNRSVPTTIPNEYNVEYYTQRAKDGGAGLILTEGTMISRQGSEWPNAPGIWDEEHANGWKKVIEAVHAEGTPIVAQPWHVGRVAHPDMPDQKKAGIPVYAPSAISARGGKFRELPGTPGYVTPTAVEDPTILLDQYTHAAKMAKEAGFDGVELHSANGYLVNQFLTDTANTREDQWGGSVENRARFGIEAAKRLIEVWGADRVGIKVSPGGGYNDMYFTSTDALVEQYKHYFSELNKLGLAYVQIGLYNAYTDPKLDGTPQGYDHDMVATYLPLLKNSNVILNTGYDAESGEKALKEGSAKAIVYGQNFIANPDYSRRIQNKLSLNQLDYKTLYGVHDGNPAIGYSDYPFAQ